MTGNGQRTWLKDTSRFSYMTQT